MNAQNPWLSAKTVVHLEDEGQTGPREGRTMSFIKEMKDKMAV